MKVLHILNELKFSGAEIMYTNAAKIFQDFGCELTVLETSSNYGEYTPYFEKSGYKVIHKTYPTNLRKKIQYYKDIIKLLKEDKYDVVHIHRANMKFGMSYCAYRAGIKSIYTIHSVFKSHWYSYILHLLQRIIMNNLFKCTFQAISDTVYKHEKQYYYNKNVIQIYNWYDSNRFYPPHPNDKQAIRERLNIPQDALVVISIGGCSPIKRHTEIIKSLPSVIKKYPNTIYIHLGSGVSLEQEEKLTKELKLNNHIRFYGNQTNVRDFLIASDIYIMCSTHEGISLTTIEAMACKIPAILYDVPGLRDFNKEKECSMLIPEDYNILSKSIIELYNNKPLQNSLIENAYTFIHNNFDMKTNATNIFKLYSKN